MEDRIGIRKVATYVSIVAAATPTLLYRVTPGRTARIKKLLAYNNTGADDLLTLGTGAGADWSQKQPAIRITKDCNASIGELDLPQLEYTEDIYAESSGAGAATAEDVQVEVEELE